MIEILLHITEINTRYVFSVDTAPEDASDVNRQGRSLLFLAKARLAVNNFVMRSFLAILDDLVTEV